MVWLNEHKRMWRMVIVVLLLLAILGPWAYDRINVPAEYPCSAPFVRLEGDFCGLPLSLAWGLAAAFSGIISTIAGVFAGSVVAADAGSALLFSLLTFLLLLPVFSTLLLIWRGDSPRLHVLNVVVWGLAAVLGWWFLFVDPSGAPPLQLWGVWLYVGLATLVWIVEVAPLVTQWRQHQ